VHRRGLAISRATVYRNLELLVQAGLAHKVRLSGRSYLYEHVHSGQRHDHMACRCCGRMVEFVSPGITALLGEICRAHGFEGRQNQLQILGICRSCADADHTAAGPARQPASGAALHV
jgi:Fur family ferric uptake transcriptional regulator